MRSICVQIEGLEEKDDPQLCTKSLKKILNVVVAGGWCLAAQALPRTWTSLQWGSGMDAQLKDIAAREAELAGYEFIVSTAPHPRAKVIGAGMVGLVYTREQIQAARKDFVKEIARLNVK